MRVGIATRPSHDSFNPKTIDSAGFIISCYCRNMEVPKKLSRDYFNLSQNCINRSRSKCHTVHPGKIGIKNKKKTY
jgi:hypothetical protein